MIYSGDLHIITILITVLIAGSAPEVQLKKRFFYLTLEEKNKSLRTVSSAGRKTWLDQSQKESCSRFSGCSNIPLISPTCGTFIYIFLISWATRAALQQGFSCFPCRLWIYIYIFTASTHLRCMYYTTGRICTLLFIQVFALLPYPLSFLRDTIMLLRPML